MSENTDGLPPLRWAPPGAETVTRLVLEIDADGRVCTMNFKAIDGKEAKGAFAAMRLGDDFGGSGLSDLSLQHSRQRGERSVADLGAIAG